MTVVVSPLIALMRDQFEKLSELGLEAVQVNTAIPAVDIRRARARIGRRTVEFVFTTPEQLAATDLRQLLTGDAVDLVVIDEAHCISQWGHDFRPAYLDALSGLRAFGSPTILALTATATPDVIADIERHLAVGPLRVINTGAHRPNLSYHVRPVSSDADKQRHLIDIVIARCVLSRVRKSRPGRGARGVPPVVPTAQPRPAAILHGRAVSDPRRLHYSDRRST